MQLTFSSGNDQYLLGFVYRFWKSANSQTYL
jgi:hypothetical protein